ncbi:MAG: PAS domain S-box protein [Bacteroidales bacterium]
MKIFRLARIFRMYKKKSGFRNSIAGKNNYSGEMAVRAFHAAPQLMAISNPNTGEIIDVNEAFLNTLGYTKKEVTGKTFEDIRFFSDMEESNKYIKLLPRFRKVNDYPVILRTKSGEKKPFLFSAETIKLDDDYFLLTTYNPDPYYGLSPLQQRADEILEDIFDTVTSYLLRVSISKEKKFYIRDINSKAEDIENVIRSAILGRYIDETPLVKKIKLIELLHHIRITGEPIKLAVSPAGDRSEGFYIGFLLSTGDIIVTWEPPEPVTLRAGIAAPAMKGSVREMTFDIDLNGRLTYAEKDSLDFIGYSEDDFKRGIYLNDFFPPDDLKKAINNLKCIVNINDTTSNEYTAIKKDGTLFPILTRTFGVFKEGKLTGYRGVVIDLTEQKKKELQIAKEKAFLECLIDSTPQAIVITDIPGKITHVNREFTKLFGYTNEEAIGNYINNLIVPDELIEEAENIDEKTLTTRYTESETVRKDKFGNRINISLISSSIIMNGVTVGMLCIYRDITKERKNRLLQEILYNISCATLEFSEIKDIYSVIVTELGKIWDTNNFFIALYNREHETLSMPFFSDEKDNFREIPVKGTITGWVINHGRSVLLKETDIRKMEDAGEIDLVGSPCKVWMGVPLKVEDENIGAMCLQDYHSEDKFTSEDLNLLELIANQIAVSIQKRTMLNNLVLERKKAEEAALSKQVFISTMSHEIRTPLNEVIGISNLLLQTNPHTDQLELIKTLRFSANHLMTLVNDVLDYSKMESGKIVFEQIQFNLNNFLDEIRRSYSYRAKQKNLEFSIIKNPGVPDEVIGDQIRLNQILSNLLSNAFKFTSEGSVTITVTEKERTGNKSTIEFKVSDTGIGVPEDKQNILFDSFTQATPDTTRRFGGTGLGLAICKKLVELQGGRIYVKSKQGKGSDFIFTFTLGVPEQAITPVAGIITPESYKGLEGKKILVAEDNKINFFVVNKFLISWGVNVTHAENGKIALDFIEKNKFDLILMDLHMPVLDGIEAIKIIRNSDNPEIRNIPIVALTAAIMSENNDRIEGLNINDYILKPFKPQDLYNKILKHIKLSP